MYRSESLSPQYGNEVSVMALSDSDTTASPTLGSSSASEKFRELKNAESFNLSFDGKSDKSGLSDSSERKVYSPEVNSAQLPINYDDVDDTSADNETVIIHDDSDGSFKRNGENRTSDISDNSSISQGIQADKDFSKPGSDVSDVSMTSEGRLTPKNRQDLENYLQATDESGIVSETTSSNHSESSQQSEHTTYRFDPSEIAQKIMCDVSEHKTALDSMQKLSIIQSQTETHILRSEYQKENQPSAIASTGANSSDNIHDNISSEKASVQSKIAAFSGNTASHSAFTSPSHKSRLPPPVASKPTFQSNASGFRNLSTNVSNLAAIPATASSESLTESSKPSQALVSRKKESPSVPSNPVSSSVFTTTAILLGKQDSFSSSTSACTTMSFSSFRPAGKPIPAEGVSNILQHRPDSTTSTSSHCSTPSSMQSVIYRPYGDKRTPDSPCVVSYDSSSDQTSGSGSTSTITPTVSMTETMDTNQNDVISNLKRDSSPALSSCSSASGRSGKQKKKVSFSDSEPSDTPSPHDSSASSNQLSYFDLKKSGVGNIPLRQGNTEPSLHTQNSHQSSSNSSLDSPGKVGGNSQRPPPPSYQYAIRNSQLLQNKSTVGKPSALQQQSPRHSYSSNSSLNNSLDEINRLPPSQMSPIRTSGNSSLFQQHNLSEQDTSYMLNQSMPANSSFAQSAGQYPNQSYPPQNVPSRGPRNSGLSPVRNPGLSPVRSHPQSPVKSHGLSPVRQNPAVEQTPEIPPRGIAPVNRQNYMKPPNGTISQGQGGQGQRLQTFSAPALQNEGHMTRGQLSPKHQFPESRSHMATISEQLPNDIHVRPNSLQISNPALSPTKTALIRQPLSSPDAPVSPEEYFPPAPDQFRGSGYLENQTAMPNTFSHLNYQRSLSMDFISRNGQNDQNKSLSQSYDIKDFPSKFSSSVSLNQRSPSHTRVGPHIPSANQIRESLVNRNASANQICTGQGTVNRNGERRNPPVPPARIDSWENMDKHMYSIQSEQRAQSNNNTNQSMNNTFHHFYGQNGPIGQSQSGPNLQNNQNKIAVQNGYLPTRELTEQMYSSQTKVYPMNNTVPQSQQNHANGNIPNLQLNPTNVGPLRRIGIGSDKKSFAKSNVIQASKC